MTANVAPFMTPPDSGNSKTGTYHIFIVTAGTLVLSSPTTLSISFLSSTTCFSVI
ncbi:hypothetical protein Hanom_Chr15g01401811 [Helianthus anomalus]